MSKFSASAAWAVVKDIVLTGLGVWIIVSQVQSSHPSDPLLVVAMGLCAPAIYDHAKSLVSGPSAPVRPPPGGDQNGGTSSSSDSAPPSSSPASSSSPGSGDHA